jgi:hypothetical protein
MSFTIEISRDVHRHVYSHSRTYHSWQLHCPEGLVEKGFAVRFMERIQCKKLKSFTYRYKINYATQLLRECITVCMTAYAVLLAKLLQEIEGTGR